MTRRLTLAFLCLTFIAANAHAQAPRKFGISGYGTYGSIDFTAKNSFDTVIGKSSGPLVGGGVRVGLPWFNLFVDVGGWKFDADGQRVIRLNGQTYPLGIPVKIAVTPVELTMGYRFNQIHRWTPRLTPYLGGGYTSLKYQETSTFAAAGEDVNKRYPGRHVWGGAEIRVLRWIGVSGEFGWTSVKNAIGDEGVSKEFGESDLGGKTLRVKVSIGR